MATGCPRTRWLAAGLTTLLAIPGTAETAPRPLAAASLIRRGPDFAQLRSFLAIGRFHLDHNRPDRARQILLYGLLHAPAHPELLTEAARAELRLGRLEDALELIAEAQRLEPSSERAWTLTEVRRLLAAKSAASAPVVTASTPPAAAASAPVPAAPTPSPPTGELAGKTRALHVALALEAAVKGFNAGKKKSERMGKFDLDRLKKEHFLPDDFSLDSVKIAQMTTEGVVTLEEYGTVAELKTASQEFETLNADISRRLNDGAFAEAVFRLREMAAKFPKEPAVRARLLYALRAQGRVEEALKEVDTALAAAPSDPALGYEKTMLLLETGRPDEAAKAAKQLGSVGGAGVHGVLARRLSTLLNQGLSRELEQDLRSADSVSTTTAASSPARGHGP